MLFKLDTGPLPLSESSHLFELHAIPLTRPSTFPPPCVNRHLDCAWAYKNEQEVGEGIKESGVPRSEIFITTKVSSLSLAAHRRSDGLIADAFVRCVD